MVRNSGLVVAIMALSAAVPAPAVAAIALTGDFGSLPASANASAFTQIQQSPFAAASLPFGAKPGILSGDGFKRPDIIIPIDPATNATATGNIVPVIDNILASVAAVPEPGTWTLMIAGFGIAGILTRRRRGGIVSFS